MKQFDAVILENRALAEDCYEMFLRWPQDVRAPFPGQVVNVHLGRTVPYLRRPFSLASYRADGRIASLIYQVKGETTEALAALRVGDVIDVLGPRGFYFQPGKERHPLLVGGGSGTGALVFGANTLAAKGYLPRLILGCEHRSHVPKLDLSPLVALTVCTEDGSQGFQGTPADYLNSLAPDDWGDAFVWAAGPSDLLKAVHQWSQARSLPCKVALEQVIACGVGACLGCAVPAADGRGMVRVCTEGPVFPSEAVAWT
jgi:dihydroorotate dehydrogenase electron transfer subunit